MKTRFQCGRSLATAVSRLMSIRATSRFPTYPTIGPFHAFQLARFVPGTGFLLDEFGRIREQMHVAGELAHVFNDVPAVRENEVTPPQYLPVVVRQFLPSTGAHIPFPLIVDDVRNDQVGLESSLDRGKVKIVRTHPENRPSFADPVAIQHPLQIVEVVRFRRQQPIESARHAVLRKVDVRVESDLVRVRQAQLLSEDLPEYSPRLTVPTHRAGLDGGCAGSEDTHRRIEEQNSLNSRVPREVLQDHVMSSAINSGVVLFPEKDYVIPVVHELTALRCARNQGRSRHVIAGDRGFARRPDGEAAILRWPR